MFVCGVQRIFRVTGGRRGCLDIYSCLAELDWSWTGPCRNWFGETREAPGAAAGVEGEGPTAGQGRNVATIAGHCLRLASLFACLGPEISMMRAGTLDTGH